MMKAASLVKLYLPDPPTPTNKACPEGGNTILVILQICFMASSNKTNPMTGLLSLYSFKASSKKKNNLLSGI